MDMKKILQALDGVAERKVEGANDMKKFLSIVAKEPVKESVKESVITSFEEDTVGGDANSFLIAADNINDLVMGNVEKIKINADERLLKDMMDKFNSFMTAYHAVGKEILQPDMFNDDVNEKIHIPFDTSELPTIPKSEPSDDSLKVGQMVKFGVWQKPQEHRVGKIVSISEPGYEVVVDVDGKQVKLNRGNKSLVIHPVEEPKQEGIHNGLAFKDYFALEEAKKKITKKEDPCWSGYHMVGTKNKGGKEVPNCVPGKKGS